MSEESELPVVPISKPPEDGPKEQWIKQVVNAAGAAHRIEKATVVARRAVQEGTDRLRANGRNGSEAKYKQNQPPELELKLNPHLTGCSQFHADSSTQIPEDSANVTDHAWFMKNTHRALYERLNMYCIVFVLLESMSFVAILQPPGGFDNDGHMRSNTLVTCFVFFSTLSFFFTTIGLFGVVVGFLSLLNPDFYRQFEKTARSTKSGSSHKNSLSSDSLFNTYQQDDMPLDNVLAKLLWENLERMWRLRIYLFFSLVLIVSAFGCGVFAILGGSNRTTHMLAGAITVGVVTLVFEVFGTVQQGIYTYHRTQWLFYLHLYYPGADLPSKINTPRQKLEDWIGEHVHSPRSGSARAPRGPSKLSTSSNLGSSNNA